MDPLFQFRLLALCSCAWCSGGMEKLECLGVYSYGGESCGVSNPKNYFAEADSRSIYLGRAIIRVYYTYRIDSVTRRLEECQTERTNTIDKLKAATKYNSTQQLLEKYGGAPPPSKPKAGPVKTPPKKTEKQAERTTMGPPATANIPRNQALQPFSQAPKPLSPTPQQMRTMSGSPIAQPGPPEFAPNAFSGAAQYDRGGEVNGGGNWYDRILDLLLGEDETSPKNRMVLICKHCRLVNGQAPPGIKRLEDLGKWRCTACGGWNGEVDEGTKIVAEITGIQAIERSEIVKDKEDTETLSNELDQTDDSDEVMIDGADLSEKDEDSEPAKPSVKAKRGRPKKS